MAGSGRVRAEILDRALPAPGLRGLDRAAVRRAAGRREGANGGHLSNQAGAGLVRPTARLRLLRNPGAHGERSRRRTAPSRWTSAARAGRAYFRNAQPLRLT